MQRTPAWFEQRRNKITASNVGACLGLVSYTSRKKAYERALGSTGEEPQAAEEVNPACSYGIEHEPIAIAAYSKQTGNRVEEAPFVVHSEIPWLGASPDGYIGQEGLLEIKCPFYSRAPHSSIPMHYYLQVIVQLECCPGRKWCDFYSWTPDGAKLFRVQADPSFFKWLYFTHLTPLYEAIKSRAGGFPTMRDRAELQARISASMQTHIVGTQPTLAALLHFPPPEADPFTSSNDMGSDGPIDLQRLSGVPRTWASDRKRERSDGVRDDSPTEPPRKRARTGE